MCHNPVKPPPKLNSYSFIKNRSYSSISRCTPDQSKSLFSIPANLQLIGELDAHQGCVNTLSWNSTGSLLVSGSDDCHLMIHNWPRLLTQLTIRYDMIRISEYRCILFLLYYVIWVLFILIYSSFKLLHSIPSGHVANIFSAHFLPRTHDSQIISCAGNGTIHLTYIDRPDSYGNYPFYCNKKVTYQLAVTDYCPYEFLSCGEDGTVRVFDLRVKQKCLCRLQECKVNKLVSDHY